MTQPKDPRGGPNRGQGRKPTGQTVTVSFRIKADWRQSIKEVVRAEIKRLKQ